MRKLQSGLAAALLFITTTGCAETLLTLEITNTGWVTPLYTQASSSNVNALLDKSFLFTEISPQMKKAYTLIVDRFGPPPPEKLEISFYGNPNRQGEPAAKWGYSDWENPMTGNWEDKLCDFNVDNFVSCFYTGDAKRGYFVFVEVDGDAVGAIR